MKKEGSSLILLATKIVDDILLAGEVGDIKLLIAKISEKYKLESRLIFL